MTERRTPVIAAAGLVVLGMLAIGVVGAVAGTAALHGDETPTGNETATNETATAQTGTATNRTAANGTAAAEVPQNADVFVTNQTADAELRVGGVSLPEGGFLVVFNATMARPMAHSEYLEAGRHTNATVSLNESVSQNETLIVAAFHDTNGNQQFDRGVDEVYLFFDEPVMDAAGVGPTQAGNATETPTATDGETATPTDAGGNGTDAQDQTATNESGGEFGQQSEQQNESAANGSGDEFEQEAGPNDNESQQNDAGGDQRVTTDEQSVTETEAPDEENATNRTAVNETAGNWTAGNETAANETAANRTENETARTPALFVTNRVAGDELSVSRVALPEGGFLVVYNATMAQPMAHSQYLEAGVHRNVSVGLDESASANETLVVAAFHDTNGNQQFDRGVDEIYLFFDDPVVAAAGVSPTQAGNATATPTAADGETATPTDATANETATQTETVATGS